MGPLANASRTFFKSISVRNLHNIVIVVMRIHEGGVSYFFLIESRVTMYLLVAISTSALYYFNEYVLYIIFG